MPEYTPIPTPTPLYKVELFNPQMLDKFVAAHPATADGGKFTLGLLSTLQNHLPLTFFQKCFLFLVSFVPGPYSWKLTLFSFLYTLPDGYAPFLIIALLVLFLLLALYLLLQAVKLRAIRKEPLTFLELVIPTTTAKSAYATEQFFTLLHTLAGQRRGLACLTGRRKRYALELSATREQGIRYILGLPEHDVPMVERGLLSYLPGLRIRPAKNDLPLKKKEFTGKIKAIELKLNNDFILPLSTQKTLAEHDPIAYLAGNMTKLQKGERMIFHVMATPVTRSNNRGALKHIAKIRWRLTYNKPIAEELNKSAFLGLFSVPLSFLMAIIKAFQRLLKVVLGPFILTWDTSGKSAPIFNEDKSVTAQLPQPNPYEEELETQAKAKIDQPLFETSIRLLVVADEARGADERISGFLASLGPFATVYQSLEAKAVSLDITSLWSRIRERRLTSFQNPILTPSELTDLYHFPHAEAVKTEGLVRTRTRDLPAPLSQKQHEDVLDVVIGENTYGGEKLPVGLTAEERHQHTYIVGKTGTGKSTVIAGMALQDMAKGKGLCVIDPHGDLVNHLLTQIPEKRRKDVVYVSPADKEFPIGLNILNPGLNLADKEEEHEWIMNSVMSIFMKITPPAKWGQRMEHILRNACLTALAAPKSPKTPYVSLYTIQKLLTDIGYRKEIIKPLKDPVLKQFWTQEFSLQGKMQQADTISPLTNKLGEFLTSPLSRRILLQEKSTINLSEIMDSGKILLVNLSKGELGEERSAFFGTVMVSLIQLAMYARVRRLESKRRDFFVYIDEFQNFATPHFTSLFSESRKFHVFFIPTHQSIAQIEDEKITSVISGNAGTLISLKVGPDDEAFILPFMRPEVEKGEIVNLPPHHFFMKVTSSSSEDSFSGVTIPLSNTGSIKKAESIIAQSREQYATPREIVEAQLTELLAEPKTTPVTTTKPSIKKEVSEKKAPDKLHRV